MTTDPDKQETVTVFRGRPLRTPEDWLGWALICWGWEMGFGEWTAVLRGVVKSLRALEAGGALACTRVPGGTPRRRIELTDAGRALADWLVGARNPETPAGGSWMSSLGCRLDRLGRSLKHLISVLEELPSVGVAFVSLAEGRSSPASMPTPRDRTSTGRPRRAETLLERMSTRRSAPASRTSLSTRNIAVIGPRSGSRQSASRPAEGRPRRVRRNYCLTSSTRRFFARPSSVRLSAIGVVCP